MHRPTGLRFHYSINSARQILFSLQVIVNIGTKSPNPPVHEVIQTRRRLYRYSEDRDRGKIRKIFICLLLSLSIVRLYDEAWCQPQRLDFKCQWSFCHNLLDTNGY